MFEVEAFIFLPLPDIQVHGVLLTCNYCEQDILESVIALMLRRELRGLLWSYMLIYTSEMWVTKSNHESCQIQPDKTKRLLYTEETYFLHMVWDI